jgi:endonuclease/exonuclease/phosphatase family metal-dependent hydrolase
MKLLSINIEDTKHISTVTALITKEQPDILCLQEVCEKNLEDFSRLIGGTYSFAAMAYKDTLDDRIGVAVFTALPVVYTTHLLKEADKTLTSYVDASFEDRFRSQSYYALEALVTDADGCEYRFYTIHLPVTEGGSTSDFQLEVVDSLLSTLAQHEDAIVAGDSNAPRGGEAFSRITAKYRDNIPLNYTTSIDGSLHRAGALQHMVDVLFTTPAYQVMNVRFIDGVSDHYALVAEVSLDK